MLMFDEDVVLIKFIWKNRACFFSNKIFIEPKKPVNWITLRLKQQHEQENIVRLIIINDMVETIIPMSRTFASCARKIDTKTPAIPTKEVY
jgi:hypothetical protein